MSWRFAGLQSFSKAIVSPLLGYGFSSAIQMYNVTGALNYGNKFVPFVKKAPTYSFAGAMFGIKAGQTFIALTSTENVLM